MANLLIRDGMNLLRTGSTEETVYLVLKMVLKVDEFGNQSPHLADVLSQMPLVDYCVGELKLFSQKEDIQSQDLAAKYRCLLAHFVNAGLALTSASSSPVTTSSSLPPSTYLDVVGRRKVVKGGNNERGSLYLNTLACVPGMSVSRAHAVAKHWPSFAKIMEQLNDKKEFISIVSKILIPSKKQTVGGKSRCLGPKIAERIFDCFIESVENNAQ